MSEWAWVVFGYGVAYGALGGYLLVLARQRSRVRRRARALR